MPAVTVLPPAAAGYADATGIVPTEDQNIDAVVPVTSAAAMGRRLSLAGGKSCKSDKRSSTVSIELKCTFECAFCDPRALFYTLFLQVPSAQRVSLLVKMPGAAG